MKQKVYVLNELGCMNERYIVGVFSSRKKAEEAKKWIIQNDTYYRDFPNDLDIDVFEMNGEMINAV